MSQHRKALLDFLVVVLGTIRALHIDAEPILAVGTPASLREDVPAPKHERQHGELRYLPAKKADTRRACPDLRWTAKSALAVVPSHGASATRTSPLKTRVVAVANAPST